MWSIYRLLVFALAAASGVTPVHLLVFCPSAGPDCHSDDDAASTSGPSQRAVKSRWNVNVSELIQDLDQFRVSCTKLLEAFPIDEVSGNFVHTVKNCIFSKSIPTPLKGPLSLAAVSKDVIEGILDLDVAVTQSDEFRLYASGGRLLSGSEPLAHRYGGHQFGYWAGQLGDGRAHFLGQYSNRKGEIWELQLKGSGKTPYSRSGDGRAVIRSSVREFLCSEAMHFLGVPTSRAASLIVSEEPVFRDKFYNGNVKTERGAVVLRLAKSWFRIGSLEILAQSGETDLLRKLLNFVIDEHFPSISSNDPDKYLVFYSTVVNETAHLIGQWMSVGFAHGVCNTDNFSLLSITIDYGPFGFMESYNPNFIPNTSDDEGRYRIGAQADVGLFNLEKLLSALSPVFTHKQQEEAKIILKGFVNIYQMRIHQIFKAKLGLLGEEEEDSYLIPFLLQMMEDTESDFTMTFRQLSEVSHLQLHNRNFAQMWALDDLSTHQHFSDWLNMYLLRISRQQNDGDVNRQNRMKNVNPRYVLRNWMAESAIRKAEMNDFSEVELLHHILSSPFVTQETAEEAGYAARPPSWAQRLKVSCSS
ncbi:protein adenylyltransferase SelO-like [Hippoglossus hippoglossus]|uniref:protein adenylyltransferase SelO-like n=1 Tax=Hippoglossus hippoglossus TaxID=8267 RepID=UPI00148B4D8A|nr:protein adenylyltransferase SelO-like [Hippoglossus hippoglossus]XP_034428873.1 protein adenylyltransferase SelO-like [Hippoglossus hippoglossus]